MVRWSVRTDTGRREEDKVGEVLRLPDWMKSKRGVSEREWREVFPIATTEGSQGEDKTSALSLRNKGRFFLDRSQLRFPSVQDPETEKTQGSRGSNHVLR